MARFGNLPINIPAGVKVEVLDGSVKVTGPKGEIVKSVPREVTLKLTDNALLVERKKDNKFALSIQGTTRSHIFNAVQGVSEGWTKTLELVGAGYRGEVRGKDLVLTIGYSHPVIFTAPEGITFSLEKNIITVSGADIEAVSQLASEIRASRKPDPYKGKGVKYVDEVIRRKAGKQAAKAEA